MKYLIPVILVFVSSCVQPNPRTEKINSLEDLIIKSNCDGLPKNTPCFETHIPNQCENGFQDSGFCRVWSAAHIEGGKTLDGQKAELEFEMTVRLGEQDFDSKVIFRSVHPTPCGMDARIGFLGYSDDGFPIVNSAKGPAELRNSDVHIGYKDARIVIDTINQKIVARYLAPNDAETGWSFRFDRTGSAFLNWSNSCFQMSKNYNQELRKIGMSNCDPKIDRWNEDGGTSPSTSSDKALAREVLLSNGISSKFLEYVFAMPNRVTRITGTDLVVVNLVDACT